MRDFLRELGIGEVESGASDGAFIANPGGSELVSVSPIDGKPIARILQASEADYERIAARAHETFLRWRRVPAPRRGDVVRQIGLELRKHKTALGKLISLEMGKIAAEGEGEVQEAIDMADFATGLSRQLYGLTMPSERSDHRLYEQWHPLGPVGVITAFNFPAAVWAWNAMLALACGDTVIWKPSSKTPLVAIAVQKIAERVLARNDAQGTLTLAVGGGRTVGEKLLRDRRVPLISATGSCDLGRRLTTIVGERLGRTILELGGNNAVLVMNDADLDLALRAVVFGAIGTSGQRCTSTRRVILERGIAQKFTERLLAAYAQVKIGDPLDAATNMGPLVDAGAADDMFRALDRVKKEGGEVLAGGKRLSGDPFGSGCYVEPTVVRAEKRMPMLKEETFAPILYLVTVDSLDEAIEVQNDVPQGLSSSIFTNSFRSAERFLSPAGSDCGIANVNVGTSGAEIGGAFGGEKETGGGRESGSDAWKAYMRRQTNTVNFGTELPLAQGIRFNV